MPAFSRPGFASRFFWISMLLVLGLLWAGMLHLHRDAEARALANLQGDARNFSLAFAEHTKASFQRIDNLSLQLRSAWLRGRQSFDEEVKTLKSSAGDLAFQVAVIGADGRLDFSNLAFVKERIDLSDREHFRAVRDSALAGREQLFISRPLLGRVSGRWSIQFARPIMTAAGFAGVLVLSVDPAYFVRIHESLDLGSSGVVTLVRHTGEILTRAPGLDNGIGKVLADVPYLAPDAPEAGGFSRKAQVDGVLRYYFFRRLPAYGVSVVVGVGVDEGLRDVGRQSRLQNIAAAIVTLILFALMFVVARAQAAQRKSRDALVASENVLRHVQEVMPAGIVVIDRGGRITECNPAAEQILCAERSLLVSGQISLSDWHAVRPDGTPMPAAEMPGTIALRERRVVSNVEMGIHREACPPAWLMVSAAPLEDNEGHVVIAFTDISEHRRHQQMLTASERRFRAMFDSFSEVVFVIDPSGRFTMVHFPAGVAQGVRESDWVGRDLSEKLPADVAAQLSDALAAVLVDGEPRSLEVTLGLSGDARRYLAAITAMQAGGPWPEGFVMVLRDVTTERAIAEAQRVAATTFESQEGMMITDGHGIIMRVNRAFTDLTGYLPEEVVGKSPAILKSGRQGDDFYRAMWATLIETGYWQGEVWNRRKGGEVYPEWLTISAVTDDEGRTTHYVGAFSDITERKEAEERIRHLAFYDPLTTLPNRRLLLDRLNQALAASQRTQFYGALLYLDLDHFKVLNDTRGHDAGDELLIQVAERLRAAVREQDTVARLGGDEFVVMLEDLDVVEAQAGTIAGSIAEKIRSALDSVFRLKGGDYSLTPSIGVSMFRGHEFDVQALMKQADMALYEAKEHGRNTVRFFSHAMQEAVAAQAAVLTGLRRAITQNEFVLHLQPQFDGEGARIGAEALIRWQSPEQGLVMPDAFIPQAENSGLIVPLGAWVVEQACAVLAGWQAEGRDDECLSINVSARQFRQPDFVDVVAAALSRHGVNGSRLCLELTETALLRDVATAAETMGRLRALGVVISLDDFGTGFSSLSNLQRLPIDEVKIDRSFIREITRNEQDAAIVRSLITMCHDLGLCVVAEGVEDEAQRGFLLEWRCDVLQGYLLGRPAPCEAAARKACDQETTGAA